MTLLLADLLAATGGQALAISAREFRGAAIDSRSLREGELFFALRAARDGHEFVPAAVAAGAAGVVIEPGRPVPAGVTTVAVDSPRRALGAFARAVRGKWDGRLAGVTGSVGKTTTKELLAAALGEGTLKTEGNLNNDLGVPLTLLRLEPAHRFAVVEMGMSGRGEIAHLATLAEPEVGVVTLVAPAHLEQLGTLEAIAQAKGELYHGLRAGGTAVVPDDDPRLLAEAAGAARQLCFGETPGADVRLCAWRSAGPEGSELSLAFPGGESVELRLPLVGRHNARNAAAAAAAAFALGRTPGEIARGLTGARPPRNRSEVLEIAGRHILCDLYNANPTSTRAALETLVSLRGGKSAIAILGDMLELGPTSAELHREVGAHLAALGVDRLVGVGKLGREIVRGALASGLEIERVFMTDAKVAAAVRVAEWSGPGDWILVKGSRGMQMEDVVEALREELG